MLKSNKSILVLVACICFAIAVVTHGGWVTLDTKIDWTDLGLFFGFLSFIFYASRSTGSFRGARNPSRSDLRWELLQAVQVLGQGLGHPLFRGPPALPPPALNWQAGRV